MFDPFDPFDPVGPVEPVEPVRRPEARRWTAAASRPVQPGSSSPRPTPEPSDAASTISIADLASFRASTLSVLRQSIERLRAFGHVASMVDVLDDASPTVSVHFTPDRGPLATWSENAPEPARFELRIACDPDGGTQVVAGYTPGSVGAPFTLLGRTHVDQMDRSWVTRRFVEFIQRVLKPS